MVGNCKKAGMMPTASCGTSPSPGSRCRNPACRSQDFSRMTQQACCIDQPAAAAAKKKKKEEVAATWNPLEHVRNGILGVLDSLDYVHDAPVCHRDDGRYHLLSSGSNTIAVVAVPSLRRPAGTERSPWCRQRRGSTSPRRRSRRRRTR